MTAGSPGASEAAGDSEAEDSGPPQPVASRPRGISLLRAGGTTITALYNRVRNSRWLRHRYAPWGGLAAASAIFSLVLGWVWSARYWAFQTSAWDLGIYFQAMYTAAVDHRFLYYTAELPAGTHGYLFATHFSPFLLLLLPLFVLDPTPSTLLVLQAMGLAAGVIPVYFLARFKLGPGAWPALLAGLYLLSPLTIGAGWYDFHPEAFLPATALTAFYFFERRRLYPFLAAWILTLSVIETIAPFLVLFGGAALALALWRYFRRPSAELGEEIRFGLWAVALAIASYAISAAVVLSLNQSGGTFGSSYGQAWSILGAQSILDVFPRALLTPTAAALALSHDAGPKLIYIALVLGSFIFLPLFGRLPYLLPAAAWLGLALLSNDTAYYVINDQYVTYLLPFLIPATITGVIWWRGVRFRWKPRGRQSPIIASLLVVALVSTSAVSSPFLGNPIGSFNAVPHGLPVLTAHDRLLHAAIGMIPPGASVLTTARLFPELANRPNAYVLPVSTLFLDSQTFEGVVGQYINASQYVLVDYQVDFSGAVVLLLAANLSNFGLEAAAGGAYLYQRGWVGAPGLWIPYALTIAGGDLTPELGLVDPSVTTSFGPTMYHPPTVRNGTVWQGPQIEAFPPGEYRVTAWVELTASTPGPTGGFAVLNATIGLSETVNPVGTVGHSYSFRFFPVGKVPAVISNQTVGWNGTGPSLVFVNWTSEFNWTGPGFLETRGFALSPGVGERLYWVSILQLSPR
jgi:uncharacterized membrane protein